MAAFNHASRPCFEAVRCIKFCLSGSARAVLFGSGSIAQLAAELDKLDVTKVLGICTPSGTARYAPVIDALGMRCVELFTKAEPHCPEEVALAAQAASYTCTPSHSSE